MKFTCPNCYETLSLAALIEHDAAREAVRLALEFPAPLGKQFLQYASLFKPAQRALSMDRFASILNDLLPMIKAAQIERNGRLWPAPQSYWSQAFDSMLSGRDKLSLPLKSHGYLLEILAGFANKAEAKAETKHEQTRKYGEINHAATDHVVASAPAKKAKSTMPDNVKATLDKLTGKGL
ncbi:MAG TPA: hypothetical protein DCG63_03895 [Methylophilaceae bacterium]|nr:hypothetical protein [Methylophilaceae bacterium]